jgi:hypothetical protein
VNVLAIDPGWEQSAYVIYDGYLPERFGKITNDELLKLIREGADADMLVIEQVACMGMAVGEEVFETCVWSGRFIEAWGGKWDRVKRHEVKMALCGNMRAKDGNIRTAIIDRYGPGKDKAIGRKASPGPLYGLSGDCWQALGVAITWTETKSA